MKLMSNPFLPKQVKSTAFSWVVRQFDIKKARLLYTAFIMSNLRYCPLGWMFCGKAANREITESTNLHYVHSTTIMKARLKSLYKEQTVHTKNLHKLKTEVI